MNPTESRKRCNIFRYPFVLPGISRASHQPCPKLRVQITGREKCAIYKVSNRKNPKSHMDNYEIISLQHTYHLVLWLKGITFVKEQKKQV